MSARAACAPARQFRWVAVQSALAAALSWLVACANTPAHTNINLRLLPILPVTAEVPAAQQLYSVRATERGKRYDLLTLVARRGDGFVLSAMSELGLTLFTWPGASQLPNTAQNTAPMNAPGAERTAIGADPEIVVRMMQLSLWPLAEWRRALAGTPWRIEAPTPTSRLLRYNAALIARVQQNDDGGTLVTACARGALSDAGEAGKEEEAGEVENGACNREGPIDVVVHELATNSADGRRPSTAEGSP